LDQYGEVDGAGAQWDRRGENGDREGPRFLARENLSAIGQERCGENG
jgi:hypothetical protein